MGTRTGTYYTGTITGQNGTLETVLDAILVTGEGWTKLFDSTDKAVYQQAAGSGFVLRIVDDGSLAAGAREAIVRPAESASDVDTLNNPWPATSDVSDANCVWRKSDTADSTTRDYWAVADDRFFILVIRYGTGSCEPYYFGDMQPYWSGDNYMCGFVTRRSGNSSTSGLTLFDRYQGYDDAAWGRMYFAREADGLNLIEAGAHRSYYIGLYGNTAGSPGTYPDPQNGKMQMRFAEVRGNGQASGSGFGARGKPRGLVPFLFEPFLGTSISSMAVFDTFTDSAYGASSEFILFCENPTALTNSGVDRYVLQIGGTWDPGF